MSTATVASPLASSSYSSSVTAFHDYLCNTFISTKTLPHIRCTLHTNIHKKYQKRIDKHININTHFINRLEYFYPLCTGLVVDFMHNMFNYTITTNDNNNHNNQPITYSYKYNQTTTRTEYFNGTNEEYSLIMPTFYYDYCYKNTPPHMLTDAEEQFVTYIDKLFTTTGYVPTESADVIGVRHGYRKWLFSIPLASELEETIKDECKLYLRDCYNASVRVIEECAKQHKLLTSSFRIYNRNSLRKYLQYNYPFTSILNGNPFHMYLTINQFIEYMDNIKQYHFVDMDAKYVDPDKMMYVEIVTKMYTLCLDLLRNPNTIRNETTKNKVITLKNKCIQYLRI